MFSQFIINFAIASRWLARHLNIKKRYAYLELENVGNFQQYSKMA